MAEEEEERGAPSTRGIWSGAVSFGLVSIPIALLPAARPGGPRFRMLGPEGSPLARRWVCSKDGAPLDDAEVVRGYEVREGRFVVVTDDELEALEPRRSKEIAIDRFVPREDVDPIYFDRPYSLAPLSSTKAYAVLARVMEKTARAAIATFVLHDREHVLALFAEDGVLRGETLRFAEDVREPSKLGIGARKADAKKVAAMRRAMAKLRGARVQERILEDTFAKRVEAEARRKLRQEEDVVRLEAPPPADEAEGDVDLTAALREALAKTAKRRPSATRRRGKHGARASGRKGGKRSSAA